MKLEKLLLETPFELTDFSNEQIKELRLGIEELGVITYLNPNIPATQMKFIRNSKKLKYKEI